MTEFCLEMANCMKPYHHFLQYEFLYLILNLSPLRSSTQGLSDICLLSSFTSRWIRPHCIKTLRVGFILFHLLRNNFKKKTASFLAQTDEYVLDFHQKNLSFEYLKEPDVPEIFFCLKSFDYVLQKKK